MSCQLVTLPNEPGRRSVPSVEKGGQRLEAFLRGHPCRRLADASLDGWTRVASRSWTLVPRVQDKMEKTGEFKDAIVSACCSFFKYFDVIPRVCFGGLPSLDKMR